ncbi:unnamed protein product [Didymodactylos carnosus]|uniref:Ig-like domain-containing protein n=1 Tax=Didymodactylos carnosus TaxID=1234261 RepID=A0A813R2K5_9BILA|nr:unnamed protein product [Didymodactylos carnosus]CAF0777152.1 unnamed protein product [Didymodactylos carnosus]CAF3514652.1 unnamed protein product [Didymodactylos carnosus]CAF3559788.1 unnamed protein product [Didymodactylos carnosus]
MDHLQGFLLSILCAIIRATQWSTSDMKIFAEKGSDLSLPCGFYSDGDNSDKTIIQWMFHNIPIEGNGNHANRRWKPLFLNTQSLINEPRYSIRHKIRNLNLTTSHYATILSISPLEESDAGIYICKTHSPNTINVQYHLRVIKSFNIDPPQIQIPANAIDKAYSIELHCILTDNYHRPLHKIHWLHNNKPILSSSSTKSQGAPPHAKITNNITKQSYVSTLYYTGLTPTVIGSYVCEYERLKKHVQVELEPLSSGMYVIEQTARIWYAWLHE